MTVVPPLVRTFSRPKWHERVRSGTNPEWRSLAVRYKAVMAVGRTSTGVSMAGQRPYVDDLMKQCGFKEVRGWGSLSVPQMLDLLATFLLQEDRASRVVEGKHYHAVANEDDYLSPDQWVHRVRVELAMDADAIDALMQHTSRVTRIYARTYDSPLTKKRLADSGYGS